MFSTPRRRGSTPEDGHRVIELACVELINYIPTGTFWHWYFNPQRDVPKASTDIHGLTAQFLADKPLIGDVAHEIVEVLAGARLIIHNAPFDMGFLNHEFGRLGLPPLSMENVTDTLALARRKHPGSPNNLDALCRRYGIDNSTRTKHGALLDSELLADVYLRLIGAEQAGLNLTSRDGAGAVEAGCRGSGPARASAAAPVGGGGGGARRIRRLDGRESDLEPVFAEG